MINLRNLRKSKEMTQNAIALLLNISRATYSAYENGTRTPDPAMLLQIAEFFDVSLDYLLGRTDIRTNTPTSDTFDDNTVVAIGRGGKRVVYNISDEDADFIDAFLSKFDKKNS